MERRISTCSQHLNITVIWKMALTKWEKVGYRKNSKFANMNYRATKSRMKPGSRRKKLRWKGKWGKLYWENSWLLRQTNFCLICLLKILNLKFIHPSNSRKKIKSPTVSWLKTTMPSRLTLWSKKNNKVLIIFCQEDRAKCNILLNPVICLLHQQRKGYLDFEVIDIRIEFTFSWPSVFIASTLSFFPM